MFCTHTLYRQDIKLAAGLSFIPWDKLHGTSILVTGATGLIGTCLIDILMERNRMHAESPISVFALGRSHERLHQRSEEHTSELQSRFDLVCRLLLEKKKIAYINNRSRYNELSD